MTPASVTPGVIRSHPDGDVIACAAASATPSGVDNQRVLADGGIPATRGVRVKHVAAANSVEVAGCLAIPPSTAGDLATQLSYFGVKVAQLEIYHQL